MTLVKADLGTKRACPSCSARFYDLQKRPIECPKCAFTFEPEALYRQRRPRQPEAAKPVVERQRENDEELEEAEDAEAAEAEDVEADEEETVLEADDDAEDVAVEEDLESAGMSVVEGDEAAADISDVDEEELDEGEEGAGLLEEVDEEEDDVSGIIDPGIAKDER